MNYLSHNFFAFFLPVYPFFSAKLAIPFMFSLKFSILYEIVC